MISPLPDAVPQIRESADELAHFGDVVVAKPDDQNRDPDGQQTVERGDRGMVRAAQRLLMI